MRLLAAAGLVLVVAAACGRPSADETPEPMTGATMSDAASPIGIAEDERALSAAGESEAAALLENSENCRDAGTAVSGPDRARLEEARQAGVVTYVCRMDDPTFVQAVHRLFTGTNEEDRTEGR